MPTNDAVKCEIAHTIAEGFDRIAEFTNLGRIEFIRRLKLGSESRVLEIGSEPETAGGDKTLIRGINTAPDLDLNIASHGGPCPISRQNYSYTNVDIPRLPFQDATFDAVVSAYGVMFAKRPDRTVAEIHRVCKPGGIIAIASWTPDSVIGQMFRITSRYGPFAGNWPFQWGRSAWTRTCFGDAVEGLEFSRHSVVMKFPFPVPSAVDFWLTYCHPLGSHFSRLSPARQTDLRMDLEWLLSNHNESVEVGETVISLEYLQLKTKRVDDAENLPNIDLARIPIPRSVLHECAL